MKTLFCPAGQNAYRLIIIFLGWGFPAEGFRHLRKPGYDILLVSDYRNTDWDILEAEIHQLAANTQLWQDRHHRFMYQEYVVVGWSFGVRMATEFIAQCDLQNLTLRLAVNGTEHHIDDVAGIPEAIFDGTLAGLNLQSLSKFRLRSAGRKEAYQKMFPQESELDDIDALKEELELFGQISRNWRPNRFYPTWDKAIVGGKDRIFPPENQRRAWQGIDVYEEPEMAHLPDFQYILDHYIVDKSKISIKFGEAEDSYTENATVQRQVAKRLIDLAKKCFDRPNSRILELGYGDGTLSRLYFPLVPNSTVDAYDIKLEPNNIGSLEEEAQANNIALYLQIDDVETIDSFKFDYDIILSSSMLQWLNSPSQLIRKCADAMYSSGFSHLAFSFYGPGTLCEVSDITGNGLKYPSLAALAAYTNRIGLIVEVAETETITLTFPSPTEAIKHLKLTGVNALPTSSSPTQIRRLLAEWPRNEAGEATLTFVCNYLILTTP